MLLISEPELVVDFDVPDDDGRSYRRALLDFSKYYSQGTTP